MNSLTSTLAIEVLALVSWFVLILAATPSPTRSPTRSPTPDPTPGGMSTLLLVFGPCHR
jgi:hypothetical protein